MTPGVCKSPEKEERRGEERLVKEIRKETDVLLKRNIMELFFIPTVVEHS